ncbi:putative phage holin [Nocardiopsis terrae]
MIHAALLLGDTLVFATTTIMWAFVVFHAYSTRWEATAAGRALFSISLVSSLLLTLGCVRILVGSHPAVTVSRAVLYILALTVLLNLLRLYIRTQCTARQQGAADGAARPNKRRPGT